MKGAVPLLTLGLWALSQGVARADHILPAEEALGPNWWGLFLVGPIPFLIAALIAFRLYRSSRRRRAP